MFQMEANPETSPYLQLARHVTHLARTIHRRVDPLLEEHLDIGARELFVLRAVETGESSPMRIAERLAIAPSSASRVLDRLVEIGLLDRASDPDDRRKTRLGLTAHGRDVMHRARQRVEEDLRHAFAGMPRAEVEDATRLLARLAVHADACMSVSDSDAGGENVAGAGLHG